MNTYLDAHLKQLRLPGIRENLAIRLQEAQAAQLGHEQFLELLVQDELALRTDRKTARALKAARFVNLKPLDRFDWQFNPNLDRRRILELGTCAFIRQHTDRLLQSAEVIPFKGRSYRLRNKIANQSETPIDNQEKKGDL